MSASSRQVVAALAAGVLFGVGLVLSGMTLPSKVIGFLDFLGGAWDPSLALVMVGAIGVHTVVYHLVAGRPSPLLAEKWSLPTRRDIDLRLIGGAALFGLGWGLGGYCPGPGVVSLVAGLASTIVFVGSMLVALAITARLERAVSGAKAAPPSPRAAEVAEP